MNRIRPVGQGGWSRITKAVNLVALGLTSDSRVHLGLPPCFGIPSLGAGAGGIVPMPSSN